MTIRQIVVRLLLDTDRPTTSSRQRRRRSTLLVALLFVVAAGSPAFSSPAEKTLFTPALDSLVALVVDETINQQYESALQHVRQIESLSPDSPVAPFFHAAVLHSMMLDYEEDGREQEFKQAVELTLARSKKLLRDPEMRGWGHFFMGGGLAYLSFYYGKQMQFVQAFRTGLNSVSALERALAADSTLYDAYLGIGVYKYYRSKYGRFLSWLPFVRDERKEGIRMVRIAVEKGKFSGYAAINTLAWILVAEKRLEEAHRWATHAAAAHPKSRFFLWTVAATHRMLGHWEEALLSYRTLLDSFREEARLRPYNELVIRTRMAEAYTHLQRWAESEEQLRLAMAIRLPKKQRRRGKKYFQKLEQLSEAHERRLTSSEAADASNP